MAIVNIGFEAKHPNQSVGYKIHYPDHGIENLQQDIEKQTGGVGNLLWIERSNCLRCDFSKYQYY